MALTILVCGDRNWTDWAMIVKALWEHERIFGELTIIQGEARGADHIASRLADAHGWHNKPFPANWDSFGPAAGPIRNRQMLKEGHPQLVLAFHDTLDASKGTKDMVDIAIAAYIPVKHYSYLGLDILTKERKQRELQWQ